MCKQLAVVKKIVEHNEVNGFGVELAQAQMEDYISMNRKVSRIEKDVNGIKKDMRTLLENQARQGGQIDLIVSRMNSPVDEERKNGIVWGELKAIMKTPMGKMIVILAVGCIALAGWRIQELLNLAK